MQGLGDKARWPRKNQQKADWKDKSKWCALHEDFGHVIEDCIALRKEISYLLSKGYLKDLLGRKKNKGQDTKIDPERTASPPADAKIINFISGGSDICGTSYSAAKRHVKEAKAERGERPTRMTTLTADKVITFDSDDRDTVQDPHHDALVITLYVANHFVRRILVDNGSSVNIVKYRGVHRIEYRIFESNYSNNFYFSLNSYSIRIRLKLIEFDSNSYSNKKPNSYSINNSNSNSNRIRTNSI
ncbi:hypothetical protein HanIR_Chr10g0473271 [Helianthus annuus]|nr:hypothetical protein HanIR_Chr10g0473271 [Helianthus annuus]